MIEYVTKKNNQTLVEKELLGRTDNDRIICIHGEVTTIKIKDVYLKVWAVGSAMVEIVNRPDYWPADTAIEIDITKVHITTINRRLDNTHLVNLKKDISANGLTAPIIVSVPDANGNYTIFDGNYRYLACLGLGHKTIKARIDTLNY